MQELSEDDIAALNDAALRSLVLRLCEAEVERAGLPRAGVAGGGHQDARDGGVDVRVKVDRAPGGSGFVPRADTIFQGKQSDIAGERIATEMRPKGVLRPAIAAVAARGGAYVIVSGRASVTDTAIQQRLAHMRTAVADHPGSDALHLDYLDRGRLATWARAYPAIAAWALSQLGREVRGWQGYGSWANRDEPADAPYLLDEEGRLLDGTAARGELLTTEQGIDRLRQVLGQPRASVRLVGLSGMGKTRLVQALFDERVGTGALQRSQVIYGDTGQELLPSPEGMLNRLIQSGQQLVLIVDNCNPETHEALTKLCADPASQVSLLTVEYDIQDDLPEKTSVFRLHSASKDIILRVLQTNAPHVAEGDCWRIADHSDGNARVALALARTLVQGETLAGMKDGEVFRRLFHQRRPEDKGLERAAQVLSLVYSFHIGEGEGSETEKAELGLLAKLSGLDEDTLYRHVAELARRGLVQSRGPRRAVLPQAIALRLAADALDEIRRSRIEETFWTKAPDRLRSSFCRRLGHLHDSPKAIEMVEEWMAPGGRLHGFADGFWEVMTLFERLAPVSPGAALAAMEREWGRMAVSNFNISRDRYARLLHCIAYEAEHFRRAVRMLTRLLTHEPERRHTSTVEGIFKGLFHLIGSGTQAPPDLRLSMIDELLLDPDPAVQAYGMVGHDEMLQVYFSYTPGGHDFGARPRGGEWRPADIEAQWDWYRAAMERLCALGIAAGAHQRAARQILGKHLPELWRYEALRTDLSRVASRLHQVESWSEGWIGVRTAIARRQSEDDPPSDGLEDLAQQLRPLDLRGQIRAHVEQDRWNIIEIIEARRQKGDYDTAMQFAGEKARDLGRQAAFSDQLWLRDTLVDLHRAANGQQQEFGEGMAEGAISVPDLGDTVIESFRAVPESERQVSIIHGYLRRAKELDPGWVQDLLERAILDSDLGPVFPILQTAAGFHGGAHERLMRSVAAGLASPSTFRGIAWRGRDSGLPLSMLTVLIEAIAERSDGLQTAIIMVESILDHARRDGRPLEPDVVALGRRLLDKWRPERESYQPDYHVIRLCEICFEGPEGEAPARSFLRNLLAAGCGYYSLPSFEYGVPVCKAHPRVALDTLLGGPPVRIRRWLRIDDDPESDMRGALAKIPIIIVITWADEQPTVRYPRLGAALNPFHAIKADAESVGRIEFTTTIVELLSKAPDPIAFLDSLKSSLTPTSWSGSLADILDRRRETLSVLMAHELPAVRAWAEQTAKELAEEAALWREREERDQRARNQRFE